MSQAPLLDVRHSVSRVTVCLYAAKPGHPVLRLVMRVAWPYVRAALELFDVVQLRTIGTAVNLKGATVSDVCAIRSEMSHCIR